LANANPDAVTQIANGLSTTTFTYDADGNVLQKTVDGTTTTYVWDYANRLTALGVGGATTTYGYDWAGNRVSQTGTSTTWIYPFKWYSVASSTGTGAKYSTTTDYVFNGDSLVATIDQETASGNATGTPATHYIHPDHLGSTNVVTNASGTVEQTLDYLPYGGTRISIGQNAASRQYIGQFADQSTLDYLQKRYYDPSRGQFLSEDPVFLGDPKNQNLEDPQSLNSYSYTNNNPITGKDPTGEALTAAQSATLISITAQLQGILGALNVMASRSGGISLGQGAAIQQAIDSAKSTVAGIAVGSGGTLSPSLHGAPPLARGNAVTDFTPYISKNGVSNVPGGNDPLGGNIMLTALSFTPIGPFGPDEIRGAGALKIIINHEHAAQHLEQIGLSKSVIDAAIKADIMKQGAGPLETFVSRTINVGGKQIEYHPWTLPNGIINVGTYFIRQ
jgi:RHS repeat-associated protein